MTARAWIERQYASILPPGAPLPLCADCDERITAMAAHAVPIVPEKGDGDA